MASSESKSPAVAKPAESDAWTKITKKAKKEKVKKPPNACYNYDECKGLAPLRPGSLTKYRRDCDACARCQHHATCGNDAMVKNKVTGERWPDCESCYAAQ
jgi:hypothetical protein